jgi:hypothetical protein
VVPTLRAGEIVVMDNLSSHKHPAIGRAIRSAGAQLIYLPPYSPDPIEQAFAKVKTPLRKENARTLEQVEAGIARSIEKLTPGECRNFFIKAGYVSTRSYHALSAARHPRYGASGCGRKRSTRSSITTLGCSAAAIACMAAKLGVRQT